MTLAVRAGYQSTNATATTVAATQPSTIVDGDILIACVAKTSNTAPTTVPTGWTLLTNSCHMAQVTSAVQVSLGANLGAVGWAGVYYKVASGESGTYTWGQAASTTWNVQIFAASGYRAPKPGGSVVPSLLCMDAQVNSRSTTTINAPEVPGATVWCDGMLIVSQFVQCVSATQVTFSALSGTMTQIANSKQTQVTQLVAFEYVDLTANPNFGQRQVTTDTQSGSTGGYFFLIPDPSSITGKTIDKRHSLPARYSKSRTVN
jgi:hypothetical protein